MKDWIEGEYVNAGTRKDKNGNLIYSLDADANGYWLSGFTDGYASTISMMQYTKSIHSLRSTM